MSNLSLHVEVGDGGALKNCSALNPCFITLQNTGPACWEYIFCTMLLILGLAPIKTAIQTIKTH